MTLAASKVKHCKKYFGSSGKQQLSCPNTACLPRRSAEPVTNKTRTARMDLEWNANPKASICCVAIEVEILQREYEGEESKRALGGQPRFRATCTRPLSGI
eukprot:6209366-Pleurochrysis_carterae.AAC.1